MERNLGELIQKKIYRTHTHTTYDENAALDLVQGLEQSEKLRKSKSKVKRKCIRTSLDMKRTLIPAEFTLLRA